MTTLPKVFLLGDSIRMSYQPLVRQSLFEKADVIGPVDNCQFSLYTLSSLNRWIEDFGTPDIIHWNNSLHDAGHNPERSPVQIHIQDYRANLQFILRQLTNLTPRIIWATITPVHPRRMFKNDQWSWRNEEIDQYNWIALEVLKKSCLAINDLHQIDGSNLDDFLSDDHLHLSDAGQIACAEAVANVIDDLLSLETSKTGN